MTQQVWGGKIPSTCSWIKYNGKALQHTGVDVYSNIHSVRRDTSQHAYKFGKMKFPEFSRCSKPSKQLFPDNYKEATRCNMGVRPEISSGKFPEIYSNFFSHKFLEWFYRKFPTTLNFPDNVHLFTTTLFKFPPNVKFPVNLQPY